VAVRRFFEIEQRNDITILLLISENDFEELLVNDLQRAIVAFVEQERPHKLLVDFVNVRRFSSETINGLIRARRRLNEYQAKMCLCSMRPEIHDVFRMMRLDGTVFDIVPTRNEALQYLVGP
jgi:anti-anti-sigma factor